MANARYWVPRASSLGGYTLCEFRAYLDRMVSIGEIPAPGAAATKSSPYADLGTLIHARMQSDMGCVLPSNFAIPDQVVFENAATLFAGDMGRLTNAVHKAARVGASAMPPSPDGQPWLAETAWRQGNQLTGHIDFLSQDFTHIVDLKTTSRKPDHNRMKPEHLVQLVAYKILVPAATTGHILYLDSVRQSWSMLVSVDFTKPQVAQYIDAITAWTARLRKIKAQTVIPHMGAHCASTFCPHSAICRDAILPPSGVPVDSDIQVPSGSASPL